MKIEISLNVAVVCAKPYAVALPGELFAVCIPCIDPKTREQFPVYMYLNECCDDDPPVGGVVAYEWDAHGRRECLSLRVLSEPERRVLHYYEGNGGNGMGLASCILADKI